MTVHRQAAVRAEAIVAAMDRSAARTGRDAGLAHDRHRLALLQGGLERAQLTIDVAEGGELGDHQRVVAPAEAMQVEDQAAEVAVGQLARLAQKPRAPAHAPARTEPGRAGGRDKLAVGRWAVVRVFWGGGYGSRSGRALLHRRFMLPGGWVVSATVSEGGRLAKLNDVPIRLGTRARARTATRRLPVRP